MTSSNPACDNTVSVDLADRSYTIHVGSGLLDRLANVLGEFVRSEHVVIITDENVGKIYLDRVVEQMEAVAGRVNTVVVPPGEPSKSVAHCDRLWQEMVAMGTDRSSLVVALGGGVVGDLAGFLAATFARGLKFIQIPTSLLSQVDSSVGGKVGINLPQSKNMVGAFWQPEVVVIDPDVLTTLDEENYRAGLAEVIKYGVIMDTALFEFLEASIDPINRRDPDTLTRIIRWCCQCKATVVAEDEFERAGRRVILNYGHTFGHAIESVYGYGQYLHGQAIAIGMTCAARLAKNLGHVSQEFLIRQTQLFHAIGLPTDCPIDRQDELVAAMKTDKKVARGTLTLVLPVQLGEVKTMAAPEDKLILQCLQPD